MWILNACLPLLHVLAASPGNFELSLHVLFFSVFFVFQFTLRAEEPFLLCAIVVIRFSCLVFGILPFSLEWGGQSCLCLFISPCCIPLLASLPPVSAVTPLQAEQFARELRLHPNQPLVQFVLDGICHGLKQGFCHSQPLKPAKRNKPSADQHASVIDDYLANEVSWGRVAGPFNSLTQPPSEQLRRYPKTGATGEVAPHCGTVVACGVQHQ